MVIWHERIGDDLDGAVDVAVVFIVLHNAHSHYVEVLFSHITDSGEALDLGELVREPLPPAFHRLA